MVSEFAAELNQPVLPVPELDSPGSAGGWVLRDAKASDLRGKVVGETLASQPASQLGFQKTPIEATLIARGDLLPDILGLSIEELHRLLEGGLFPSLNAKPLPAYRAKQIYAWLYERREHDFANMTNLPAALRGDLAARFRMGGLTIKNSAIDPDGTTKWQFEVRPGITAEMVHIPDAKRSTLCISSQSGCSLHCSFCHTGIQTFAGDLTAGEIVEQVLVADKELRNRMASDRFDIDGVPEETNKVQKLSPHEERRLNSTITNVVFMGMGEPLMNPDAVIAATRILTDPKGMGLGRKRVTISTSGIVPAISRLADEVPVRLAISLHAARDELRDRLVPINRVYPLATLMEALCAWPWAHAHDPITFEYVMLDQVNDTRRDGQEIIEILGRIPAKINLIPFNPWEGSTYRTSPANRIEAFQAQLQRGGLLATIRRPRGLEIGAACGQLRTQSLGTKAGVMRRLRRRASRVDG